MLFFASIIRKKRNTNIMYPVYISDIDDLEENSFKRNKKNAIFIFLLILKSIMILFFITAFHLIPRSFFKSKPGLKNTKREILIHKKTDYFVNDNKFENKTNITKNSCVYSYINSKLKIVHLIISRFIMEILYEFNKKIYTDEYIKNGIRVMKKYLFPSLDNQKCKDFTFVLLLGNKANITYIRSLFNFNLSFKYKIIYYKGFKKYLRRITKGSDILITTRIDYDDQIYYNAVNDVRKAIDLNKPMLLYGYNRGLYYFESNNKYYEFYRTYNNEGVMSIFVSLIIVLKKVNNAISVYDLGGHTVIKKTLKKYYKKFGIEKLNYDPAIFEKKKPKFIWVRQNYSGTYNRYKNFIYKLKPVSFNIDKFYGK